MCLASGVRQHSELGTYILVPPSTTSTPTDTLVTDANRGPYAHSVQQQTQADTLCQASARTGSLQSHP